MTRDVVTSENRDEYMKRKLGMNEDAEMGKMPKSHKPGKEMDIGEGRYLHKHGYDSNGNQSVWVSQGSGRARKIQMHNLPTVQKTMPNLTEAGAKEIHAYADKFHKEK